MSRPSTVELPSDVAASLDDSARHIGLGASEVLAQMVQLMERHAAQVKSGALLAVSADSSRLDSELSQTGSPVNDLVRRLKPDEHEQERATRLRAESRAALLDDIKSLVLFVVLLLGVLGMAGLCAWFAVFAPNTSPDTQRWAQTMLAAIVSGSVSFLLGRRVGGK